MFNPTRRLDFSGFILDSEEFKLFLTQDKEDKLIRAATDVLAKDSCTIREIAGLIGLMIAFSPAFRYAEGYVKHLEVDKIEALRVSCGDFNAQMQLSGEAN